MAQKPAPWKQILAFSAWSFATSIGFGLTWALTAATGGGLWTYLCAAGTVLCLAAAVVSLLFGGFVYVWGRLFPRSRLPEALARMGAALDSAADALEARPEPATRRFDESARLPIAAPSGAPNPDLAGFALPRQVEASSDEKPLVLKPSPMGYAYGCPGILLSGIALILFGEAVAGRAWGFAGEMLAGVLGFGVLWLPFVIYTAGTRILLSAHELQRQSFFGRRIARVERREIDTVRVSGGQLNLGNEDWPLMVDVATYSIVLRSGRTWAILRTPFFWPVQAGEALRARL